MTLQDVSGKRASRHKLLMSEIKIKDYQRILETTLCHKTRWNRLWKIKHIKADTRIGNMNSTFIKKIGSLNKTFTLRKP